MYLCPIWQCGNVAMYLCPIAEASAPGVGAVRGSTLPCLRTDSMKVNSQIIALMIDSLLPACCSQRDLHAVFEKSLSTKTRYCLSNAPSTRPSA
jgi:hypothetical protein